jgi:hypothetical protein
MWWGAFKSPSTCFNLHPMCTISVQLIPSVAGTFFTLYPLLLISRKHILIYYRHINRTKKILIGIYCMSLKLHEMVLHEILTCNTINLTLRGFLCAYIDRVLRKFTPLMKMFNDLMNICAIFRRFPKVQKC